MSTNPRLYELKTMIQTFYKTCFDNSDALSYLNDISIQGGNDFNNIAKQVLCLAIYQDARILVNNPKYNDFENILTTLYVIAEALYKMTETVNYYTQYSNLKDVILLNNVNATKNDYVASGTLITFYNKYKDATSSGKGLIKDDTCGATNCNILGITQTVLREIVYDNSPTATPINIVKNYLKYLLTLPEANCTMRIKGFYVFMKYLRYCTQFVYNAEKLISTGANTEYCNYFENTFAQNMFTFQAELSELSDVSSSDNGKQYKMTVFKSATKDDGDLCPIKLLPTDLYIDKNDDIKNYYLLVPNSTASTANKVRVNISNADYGTIINNKKKVSTITINAYSNTATQCVHTAQQGAVAEIKYANLTQKCSALDAFSDVPALSLCPNNEIQVNIYKKENQSMQAEFIRIGDDLSKLNVSIDRSKDSINKLVRKNERNKEIIANLNAKLYAYIAIFSIILIMFIILGLVDMQKNRKLVFGLVLLSIVLILNIINYFTNYNYIENFEVGVTPSPMPPLTGVTVYVNANYTGDKSTLIPGQYNMLQMGVPNDSIKSVWVPAGFKVKLYQHSDFAGTELILNQSVANLAVAPFNFGNNTSSIKVERDDITSVSTSTCQNMNLGASSLSDRVNFVNNNLTIMTTYCLEVLQRMNYYIYTFASVDIIRKLSGSMKNEQMTFRTYRDMYKYKEDSSRKTVDIMKHEIIGKNALIQMLSISALIIGAIYIVYTYNPRYATFYMILGAILLVINLYIYYLTIVQPVRTKARNKYWLKPSTTFV